MNRKTLYRQPGARRWPLLLAGILGGHGALAADEGGLGEEAFFNDLPLVVTVTRLPQKTTDVPASVTVIDRQMIEASGATDIPNLLRLVAGFQVGHFSGNHTTVTYHGMSDEYSRRMQVLVDGRSIYMPATGGVSWFDEPLVMEDIERIEVIRGPNGVTYGANSFLGVINIITYHPNEVQGTLTKVQVGEGMYQKGVLRHAGGSGDLHYRLTVEHRSDIGLVDNVDENWGLHHDDKRINNLIFRGDYRAGVNDYLTLQAGLNDTLRELGYSADITQPPHDNDNYRHYQQFKWKRHLSSEAEFELQYSHTYSDEDAGFTLPKLSEIFGYPSSIVELYFAHPDEDIVVDHNILNERHNLEFQHRFSPAEGLRLVWTAEARQDEVTSASYLGEEEAFKNELYRLSLNGEWQVSPRWVVNAGVMGEKNDITDTNFSPRLAINHRYAPNHAVRAGYTVAYRTPAMLEEYADYAAHFEDGAVVDQIWLSDGDLEPEKITSNELGFSGHSRDKRVQYDIRFFRDHLRNLIATPVETNSTEPYSDPTLCGLNSGFCAVTIFNNDGSADMEGFEGQFKVVPVERALITVGLSRVTAHGELSRLVTDGETISYDKVDQATPTYTTSLLLDYTSLSGWQTSAGLYNVTTMEFLGGGDKTGGYTTADLRLAKHFSSGGLDGTLAVSAHNISGSYFDYQNVEILEPRTYLSAEFRF